MRLLDDPRAMSERWLDICASEDLVERGAGVRFEWVEPVAGAVPAFLIRFDARAYAFLNRCAHHSVELDWLPGHFFDDAGLYLVCAMHGALYEVASGACVAGPCVGAALRALRCEERNGRVHVACPIVSSADSGSTIRDA